MVIFSEWGYLHVGIPTVWSIGALAVLFKPNLGLLYSIGASSHPKTHTVGTSTVTDREGTWFFHAQSFPERTYCVVHEYTQTMWQNSLLEEKSHIPHRAWKRCTSIRFKDRSRLPLEKWTPTLVRLNSDELSFALTLRKADCPLPLYKVKTVQLWKSEKFHRGKKESERRDVEGKGLYLQFLTSSIVSGPCSVCTVSSLVSWTCCYMIHSPAQCCTHTASRNWAGTEKTDCKRDCVGSGEEIIRNHTEQCTGKNIQILVYVYKIRWYTIRLSYSVWQCALLRHTIYKLTCT